MALAEDVESPAPRHGLERLTCSRQGYAPLLSPAAPGRPFARGLAAGAAAVVGVVAAVAVACAHAGLWHPPMDQKAPEELLAMEEEVRTCAELGGECIRRGCCADPRAACYEKHPRWAICLLACEPGIHSDDPLAARTPWSCSAHPPSTGALEEHTTTAGEEEKPMVAPTEAPSPSPAKQLRCSHFFENCGTSMCCTDPKARCFEKHQGYAACRPSCERGVHTDEVEEERTPWTCRELSRDPIDFHPIASMRSEPHRLAAPRPETTPSPETTSRPSARSRTTDVEVEKEEEQVKEKEKEGADATPACSELFSSCTESGCCSDRDAACYERDEGYAQCRRSCETGEHDDDHEHALVKAHARTRWSCNVRHASMETMASTSTSEEVSTTMSGRQDDSVPDLLVDFYCFVLVVAGSYEVSLAENMNAKGAGVFQCRGYDVFSGEPLDLGAHAISGEQVVATVVEGPLEAERGGAYGTALNTAVFVRVWRLVLKGGLFAQHGWTVKVDPDTVFFARRLEHHLGGISEEDSLYLNNCKDGLHGPLEVVSRRGMQAFGDGLDSCVEDLKFEWNTYGEDVFLRHCLGLQSATRVDIFELLDETFDGTPPSCDSQAVAFHPLKSTDSYNACLANSSQPEAAA